MESKRTEGPWEIKHGGAGDSDTITGPSGNVVAECCGYSVKATDKDQRRQGGREANAAFIVKACNNFEPLLKAATGALAVIEEAEAMEWEKGGAETIPQAEDLRRALEAIKQA